MIGLNILKIIPIVSEVSLSRHFNVHYTLFELVCIYSQIYNHSFKLGQLSNAHWCMLFHEKINDFIGKLFKRTRENITRYVGLYEIIIINI